MKNSLKAVATFLFVLSSLIVAAPSGADTPSFNNALFCNNIVVDSPCAAYTQQTEFGSVSSSFPLNLFSTMPAEFSNPGYVFVNWIQYSSGVPTGTYFSDGQTYNFASNLRLYANWLQNSVVFNSNDSANSVSTQSGSISGVRLNSVSSLGSGFIRSGFTFSGWGLAPNSSSSTYADGVTYDFSASQSSIPGGRLLYAVWTAVVVPVVVYQPPIFNFMLTAGIGSGPNISTNSVMGSEVTLPSNNGFSNSGSVFTGWLCNGLLSQPGFMTQLNSNLTCIAQWAVIPVGTITFSSNGGTGSVASSIDQIGTSFTAPGSLGMSNSGYAFLNWNTSADGTGTQVTTGSVTLVSSSITLYAQWTQLLVMPNPTVHLGFIGSFPVNSASLTPQLKLQIQNLASLLAAGKQKNVTIYGYTTYSTAKAANLAISQARANLVAQYLRTQLTAMSVFGVLITAKGEGSVRGQVAAAYRRVEIFV